MHRRWGGLLIILLVVVVAAALPNLSAKRITGFAQLAPIPGPPQVGDCLIAPEDSSWGAQGAGYAPAQLGPCRAGRYGEVVAVIQDRRSTAPAVPTIGVPAAGSLVLSDPNQRTCGDAVWRYLGVGLSAADLPVIAEYWSPATSVNGVPSGPTALQRAFGQHWVACVLVLSDADGSFISYSGVIKDSIANGTAPAAFAICLDSVDAMRRPVGCAKPHPVEVLGATSTARPGLTQEILDRSCRALVGQLTRSADPTAGGQLRVEAMAVHGNSGPPVDGLGDADDQSGFAACLVIANGQRLLDGTLIGRGDKPVPWAP